jgi:hypothetical protein
MSRSRDSPSGCHGTALDYLARGWSVIPIEPRGKRPLVAWLEYQERQPTAAEVAGWFGRWPEANVAIVTGVVSGLVVLDVDARHGGEQSLAGLETAHGPLPRTIAVATGGGGRHLYFSHPGGVVHNKVGLAPGIDVRGDGGCVIAPPSLHPSGRRYAWVRGCAPGEETLASLPLWLGQLLRPGQGRPGHPLMHWRELVRRQIPEGERNNTIASLAGHLLWHGVDPEFTLELLEAWNREHCKPPLPVGEVARVVESITRLHERRSEEEGR